MTLTNSDTFFVQEGQICLPGLTADLGEFRWGGPFETFFKTRYVHMVSMALSRMPVGVSGYYIRDNVSGERKAVGPVTFLPARTSMYQRSIGTSVRVVRCAFDASRLSAVVDSPDGWNSQELTNFLDIRWRRLSNTMVRLAEEIEAPGLATDLLVEALGLEVIVEIARFMQSSKKREYPLQPALAPWQLRRINQYVNESEGGAPTVSDLAEQCGISRAHLSRLFKATTGQTVHEYVLDVRVQRAKAYLRDTHLPLKDIASRLGFPQPSGFSIAFQKAVGQSPRVYRQQFQKQHSKTAPITRLV